MGNMSEIRGRRKLFVVLWAVLVVAVYLGVLSTTLSKLVKVKNESALRHAARLDPTKTEPGLTQPDPLPDGGNYSNVYVGTYIDRIQALSIRESSWDVDFYIWFRWKGEKSLNPASTFKVIDGRVDDKELEKEYDADGMHYQKVRVNAHITKFFDTQRFPLEDHMLNIFIEDGSHDGRELRYVVDEGASGISSRVKIPGYVITGRGEVSKPHTYRSNHGDPSLSKDSRATFSQYAVGISINRPGYGFYIKIFIALFAAIAIASIVFFIKPTDVDPRFGLAAGAFFGAVANIYLANTFLPDSGVFGLVDVVNAVGLITIFVIVAESALSLYIYSRLEDEALSRALDLCSVMTVVPLYIVSNVLIPYQTFLH